MKNWLLNYLGITALIDSIKANSERYAKLEILDSYDKMDLYRLQKTLEKDRDCWSFWKEWHRQQLKELQSHWEDKHGRDMDLLRENISFMEQEIIRLSARKG